MLLDNLLTTEEVAARLHLSERAAKKKLLGLGVQPYSFGRGRGQGYRWDRSEVEAAIRRLRRASGDEKKAKRHISAEHRRALAFLGLAG